jgi:hypothetical protein
MPVLATRVTLIMPQFLYAIERRCFDAATIAFLLLSEASLALYYFRTMFEPAVNSREVSAWSPESRPDPLLDQLRLTLAAIVGASMDGVLPADGGFARTGLRRHIAAYAANRRAAGVRAELMLVELKRLVLEPTLRLDFDERRRVTDDLIAWAIEAYYGGAESAADVARR